MRVRFLVLGLALGILALRWSRETGLSLAPSAAAPTGATPAAPKPAPAAAEPRPWPGGGRDPFRFADPEARDVRSRAAARAATQAVGENPAPPPASPSVRLVGLVRRSGGLQAALAADGEVALVSVGDRIGAFSVVSLDEEGSVRLRGPDGREVTLTLPEEP